MAFKKLIRRSVTTDAYEYKAPLEKTIASALSTLDGYPPENMQGKEPNFGTNPVIKTFYPGKGSHQNRPNWVETPPKQLKEKVAKAVSTHQQSDPMQARVIISTEQRCHMGVPSKSSIPMSKSHVNTIQSTHLACGQNAIHLHLNPSEYRRVYSIS